MGEARKREPATTSTIFRILFCFQFSSWAFPIPFKGEAWLTELGVNFNVPMNHLGPCKFPVL